MLIFDIGNAEFIPIRQVPATLAPGANGKQLRVRERKRGGSRLLQRPQSADGCSRQRRPSGLARTYRTSSSQYTHVSDSPQPETIHRAPAKTPPSPTTYEFREPGPCRSAPPAHFDLAGRGQNSPPGHPLVAADGAAIWPGTCGCLS